MGRCRILFVLRKSPHDNQVPRRYVKAGSLDTAANDADVHVSVSGGGDPSDGKAAATSAPPLAVSCDLPLLPSQEPIAPGDANRPPTALQVGREATSNHAVVAYKSPQGPLLSRRHCLVAARINDRSGAQVLLQDCGSLNGTFASRRRVPKGGFLELRLGSTMSFGAGAAVHVMPRDAGPQDVVGPGGEPYLLPEASVSFEFVVAELQFITGLARPVGPPPAGDDDDQAVPPPKPTVAPPRTRSPSPAALPEESTPTESAPEVPLIVPSTRASARPERTSAKRPAPAAAASIAGATSLGALLAHSVVDDAAAAPVVSDAPVDHKPRGEVLLAAADVVPPPQPAVMPHRPPSAPVPVVQPPPPQQQPSMAALKAASSTLRRPSGGALGGGRLSGSDVLGQINDSIAASGHGVNPWSTRSPPPPGAAAAQHEQQPVGAALAATSSRGNLTATTAPASDALPPSVADRDTMLLAVQQKKASPKFSSAPNTLQVGTGEDRIDVPVAVPEDVPDSDTPSLHVLDATAPPEFESDARVTLAPPASGATSVAATAALRDGGGTLAPGSSVDGVEYGFGAVNVQDAPMLRPAVPVPQQQHYMGEEVGEADGSADDRGAAAPPVAPAADDDEVMPIIRRSIKKEPTLPASASPHVAKSGSSSNQHHGGPAAAGAVDPPNVGDDLREEILPLSARDEGFDAGGEVPAPQPPQPPGEAKETKPRGPRGPKANPARGRGPRGFDVDAALAEFLADADDGYALPDSQDEREQRLIARARDAQRKTAASQSQRRRSLAALRASGKSVDDLALLAGVSAGVLEAFVAPGEAASTSPATNRAVSAAPAAGEDSDDERAATTKQHRAEVRPALSPERSQGPRGTAAERGAGEAQALSESEPLFDDRAVATLLTAGGGPSGLGPGAAAVPSHGIPTLSSIAAALDAETSRATKTVTFSLPAHRGSVRPGDAAAQLLDASQAHQHNDMSQWQVASQLSLVGAGGTMLSQDLNPFHHDPADAPAGRGDGDVIAAAAAAAPSGPVEGDDPDFQSQVPITTSSSLGWRQYNGLRRAHMGLGDDQDQNEHGVVAKEPWPVPQFESQQQLADIAAAEMLPANPAARRVLVAAPPLLKSDVKPNGPTKERDEDEDETNAGKKRTTKQSAAAKRNEAQKRQNLLYDATDFVIPLPVPRSERAANAAAADAQPVRAAIGQLLSAFSVEHAVDDLAASLPSPQSPAYSRRSSDTTAARTISGFQPGSRSGAQPTSSGSPVLIPEAVFDALRPHQVAALRFMWRLLAPQPEADDAVSRAAGEDGASVGQPSSSRSLASTLGNSRQPVDAKAKSTRGKAALELHLGSESELVPAAPTANAPRIDTPCGCILAHSMGLGKSFTTVAFIFTLWRHLASMGSKEQPPCRVLIVVPKSVLMHWISEIMGWGEACGEDAANVFCLSSDGGPAKIGLVRDWAAADGPRSLLVMSSRIFTRIMSAEPVTEADEAQRKAAMAANPRPRAKRSAKKPTAGGAAKTAAGAKTRAKRGRRDEGKEEAEFGIAAMESAAAKLEGSDEDDDPDRSSDDEVIDTARSPTAKRRSEADRLRALLNAKEIIQNFATLVVVDEAHKAHGSVNGLRKSAAMLPVQCKRLLLTGTLGHTTTATPAANSTTAAVGPNGPSAATPFSSMLQLVYPSLWGRRDLTADALQKHVSSVVQRCSVRAIAHELPPAAIVTVLTVLSPMQRRAFDALVNGFEPTKPTVPAKSLIQLSSKAAMVSQHLSLASEWATARGATPQQALRALRGQLAAPVVENPTGDADVDPSVAWALPALLVDSPPAYESLAHAPKLKVALHVIRRALQEQERVVVFSASVRVLVLLASYLVEFGLDAPSDFVLVDGNVPAAQRQAVCDQFNAGAADGGDGPASSQHSQSLRVVLAATQSCGVGMSFVGASRVVLIEPQWSAAAEAQAIGRVVRFGQRSPVTVVRLVADSSFELRMLRASSAHAFARLTRTWGTSHPLTSRKGSSSRGSGPFGEPIAKTELLTRRTPIVSTSDEFDIELTGCGVHGLVESGVDRGAVFEGALQECEDIVAGLAVEASALEAIGHVG